MLIQASVLLGQSRINLSLIICLMDQICKDMSLEYFVFIFINIAQNMFSQSQPLLGGHYVIHWTFRLYLFWLKFLYFFVSDVILYFCPVWVSSLFMHCMAETCCIKIGFLLKYSRDCGWPRRPWPNAGRKKSKKRSKICFFFIKKYKLPKMASYALQRHLGWRMQATWAKNYIF